MTWCDFTKTETNAHISPQCLQMPSELATSGSNQEESRVKAAESKGLPHFITQPWALTGLPGVILTPQT